MFSQYLHETKRTGLLWWAYRFPNGRRASVIPDLHEPFHFEVEYDGEDGMFTAPGLTTAEVEAKLTEVAGLPALAEVAP